jgi:hypothetical protein
MSAAYQTYRDQNSDKTTDVNILVGTEDYSNVVAPKTANHQLFIQRITISITTHFDATMTFDDDGSGPPIAAYIDEATAATSGQGQVPVVIDFGPKGRPLTVGANLDIDQSAAGIVGVVHIEAYERLGAAISHLSGASNQ